MFEWLRRRLAPPPLPSPEEERERPEWADELLSAVQKQTRAAAKQSARLEQAIGELTENVNALREQVQKDQAQHKTEHDSARQASAAPPQELFEALDALNEALRVTREPHLAEGLSRVRDRLVQSCARQGYTLLGARGERPDGRFLRIVGTEAGTDAVRGTISRVVRAAVLEGDRLVREGEVIVCVEDYHEQRVGD